jgi:hypothetical protein
MNERLGRGRRGRWIGRRRRTEEEEYSICIIIVIYNNSIRYKI